MTVDKPPEVFDFPLEMAALLFERSMYVAGTLEAACIQDRGDGEPLPRGMLTCGEAMLLIPAIAVLIVQRYPQLLNDDTLDDALRMAAMLSVTGEPN